MSFVIIDSTLRTLMGHSFAYDSATVEAAREAGWERVFVFAHREVTPEIQEAIHAVPTFSIGLDDDLNGRLRWLLLRKPRIRRNMRLQRRRLLKELATIPLDVFDQDARNLVFVPTIRHPQLIPIVAWLERINRKVRVECSIVLRFTAFPDFNSATCTAEFYRTALAYLEASPVRDRVRLYTDAQELVEEYAGYTTIPLRVIPIPHTPPELPAGEAVGDGPGGAPRLVYLGDARRNKGYHLLADLFNSLRRELEEGELCAELQSNVRIGSEFDVIRAKRALERLPNITLHEEPLTSEEYFALLHRADLVLAPYTLEHYHSQTSGIVIEAISAGKPLVLPRGTWGVRQAREFGNAGVDFLAGDSQSLLQAVRYALENLPSLKERARAGSVACRRWHNRECFFAAISNHEPND